MSLLDILRTPGGGDSVEFDSDLLRDSSGGVVARRIGETFDFVDLDAPPILTGSGPFLACDDEAFNFLGEWSLVDGIRCAEAFGNDVALVFNATSNFRLHFRRQPWSGWVAVHIDGKLAGEYDLYDAYSVAPLAISFQIPSPDRAATIVVKPLKKRSPGSAGFQVFFEGMTLLERGSEQADPISEAASVWPHPFEPAMAELGDGLALDFGSAGRRSPDPRVVSLSTNPLNLPDVRAPFDQTPFAEGVFDLIFAWHSLGRAANPVAALSELARIAAPGGRLIAAVPAVTPPAGATHLFSFTATGLRAMLARDWDVVDISPWGSPSDVIARVIDATGANVRTFERANTLKRDADEMWSRFPPESEMTAVAPFLIVDARRRAD